jgi:hypothetical protein
VAADAANVVVLVFIAVLLYACAISPPFFESIVNEQSARITKNS